MEDNKNQQLGLPNYDEVQAKELLFGAWYGPTPTMDNFQDFKDCGFNLIFLLGHLTGGMGDTRTETSLSLCDELGIQAFVDATAEDDKMLPLAETYKKHPSFKGYNYDEPVIYNNVLTKATGLIPLNDVVKELATSYPDVEFLVNLNPCSTCHFPWGTPPFTYEECLSALEKNINVHYKDLPTRKWISCDDYPLFFDNEAKTYFLKEFWLKGLEYLAEEKRRSAIPLTTNFFIQSMPFGQPEHVQNRNRVPSYEDLRLQVYTALAFGYDAISFFCYAMPELGGDFQPHHYALLDLSGRKTKIYYDSRRIISEVKRFSNTYMQFNDGWQGVYPVVGSNNTKGENVSFSLLKNPLGSLQGVEKVTATQDALIGQLQDKDGRVAYVVVNYNETTDKLKNNLEMTFASYNYALVYVEGEKKNVALENGKLTLNLDVGEGVFVIPYSA